MREWHQVTWYWRLPPPYPGRTFLGKRRYFSGIAALTPLTPLTYKQNAVNAFIPTKKNAANVDNAVSVPVERR